MPFRSILFAVLENQLSIVLRGREAEGRPGRSWRRRRPGCCCLSHPQGRLKAIARIPRQPSFPAGCLSAPGPGLDRALLLPLPTGSHVLIRPSGWRLRSSLLSTPAVTSQELIPLGGQTSWLDDLFYYIKAMLKKKKKKAKPWHHRRRRPEQWNQPLTKSQSAT